MTTARLALAEPLVVVPLLGVVQATVGPALEGAGLLVAASAVESVRPAARAIISQRVALDSRKPLALGDRPSSETTASSTGGITQPALDRVRSRSEI